MQQFDPIYKVLSKEKTKNTCTEKMDKLERLTLVKTYKQGIFSKILNGFSELFKKAKANDPQVQQFKNIVEPLKISDSIKEALEKNLSNIKFLITWIDDFGIHKFCEEMYNNMHNETLKMDGSLGDIDKKIGHYINLDTNMIKLFTISTVMISKEKDIIDKKVILQIIRKEIIKQIMLFNLDCYITAFTAKYEDLVNNYIENDLKQIAGEIPESINEEIKKNIELNYSILANYNNVKIDENNNFIGKITENIIDTYDFSIKIVENIYKMLIGNMKKILTLWIDEWYNDYDTAAKNKSVLTLVKKLLCVYQFVFNSQILADLLDYRIVNGFFYCTETEPIYTL